MRRLFLVMALIIAMPLARPAAADRQEPLPPPDFTIPFDEIDEAVLQAEITKQALAFLEALRANWGKNAAALRADVAGEIRDDGQGNLIYLRNIADHGVLEGYEFRQESLVRGQYVLLQGSLNGLNEFIGYYHALKAALAESYGVPMEDRIVWDNDLYRPLPDYWGVAVMIGHLHYHASWDTPEGTLRLELTGHHHCKLFLEYKSREHEARI